MLVLAARPALLSAVSADATMDRSFGNNALELAEHLGTQHLVGRGEDFANVVEDIPISRPVPAKHLRIGVTEHPV